MVEEPNRRRLLAALGVGAAFIVLPQSWIAPVVHSVIVPAHAQASPTATTSSTPGTSFIPP